MRTSKLIVKALAILTTIVSSVTAQIATDISWYQTNPNADVFYVSTEEHIKGLMRLVNNSIANFHGRTIILNADITLTEEHIPIGINPISAEIFRGVFDGNNRSISNLSVSNHQHAGFFGYVGEGGQIKNLTVNVSEITASSYAGGLAGFYASTRPIENCIVNIQDQIRASYSGGLVGSAGAAIIVNSYTTGNVVGGYSGGLVGQATDTIEINNSYTTGNVTGTRSGGLVGQIARGSLTSLADVHSIRISNSHSTGDVRGFFSGGLIGLAKSRNVTINNSYTTGNISTSGSEYGVSSFSGGLVGHANSEIVVISDSYVTGNVSGCISGGLTGSAGSFRNEFVYPAYFDDLQREMRGVITIINSKVEGDISGSFQSGGLVGLGNTIEIRNSHIKGNVSISSNNTLSSSGGLIGWGNGTIKISESYAISDVSASISRNSPFSFFSGGLIGRGNESIEIRDSYAKGVVFTTAEVNTNLVVHQASIISSGGLVGWGNNATATIRITNSYTAGDVILTSSGTGMTRRFNGGLIGRGNGVIEITKSYSESDVITSGTVRADSSFSGGLIGVGNCEITINNSHSTGNVSSADAMDDFSGGLVGLANSVIAVYNSHSAGSVSSFSILRTSFSGGLIGNAKGRMEIKNSYTIGDVTATNHGYRSFENNFSFSFSGGLVGWGDGIINNSYVTGNVSAVSNTTTIIFSHPLYRTHANSGGLVGSGNVIIFNSYVTGNVIASSSSSFSGNSNIKYEIPSTSNSGGLVGLHSQGGVVEINNSYVTGNVQSSSDGSRQSESNSGGLIGNLMFGSATINNSYTTGDITSSSSGLPSSGGLIGTNASRYTIRFCYVGGNITAIGGEINNAGGIISGDNSWPQQEIITSVYYNSDGANRAGSSHSNILGVNTEQLRRQNTFFFWDFENIWAITPEINNGFPHLRFFTNKCEICGRYGCEINHDTPIRNIKRNDNRYGIRFTQNIVSDKAEISVVLPKNERPTETKIAIYDMTGNVVFSTTAWDNVSWDLRNTAGRFVANGTYLVIAEAKDRNGKTYAYSARLGIKR